MRARRLLGTCDRHEAESTSGGRSHAHHQHHAPGDTSATLDERQGHVSALLHLSASAFGAIGHLRRGGKQGLARHSQPPPRPVHESHHSQYIDRKTRRSPCRWSHRGRCDGQTQTVPTRFLQKCFIVINVSSISSVRVRDLTHVFHYARCFIYTRRTGKWLCAVLCEAISKQKAPETTPGTANARRH